MNLSNTFLRLSVVAAVIGMVWGNVMGATHDHSAASAHAHLNLLGWVSMAIYGLFYRIVPQAAQGVLPRAHFWLTLLGVVLMIPALAVVLTQYGPLLPVVIPILPISGLIVLLSMAVFAFIVFRSTGGKTVAA